MRVEQPQQRRCSFIAQSNQIDRLAPRRPFLGAAGCRHLADYARQDIGRMFPTDQVEALERLVDEIERVPAIGKDTVGLCRKQ